MAPSDAPTPETLSFLDPAWRHVPIPRVSVVMPTLNEAPNLAHVIPQIPNWVHEVIVVDGRSTDGTVEVARQLRRDVRVVLESKRGKGAALRAGFACATGDIIVTIDADGSMNPNEMILLVGALLAGADFAKGSRFIEGGGSTDLSTFRALGNWGLTTSVRLLYGCRFSDLCYGYMAFWRRWTPLFDGETDGFEIETVLCVRALQHGLKIAEVASREAERVHGVSNLRAIPDGWRVLRTILRERVAPNSSRAASA
ncbi:glycosyltransferase family 2 protein [Roseiarcus fermentans]|uniref:glycosyltransferase family 2 protein n=1 Tax=Roseiarcus fermentans TaxID=1473586 RepID=UPI001FDEEDED|nr:glycosyltransferase family 2 protein [Roseiarcus fermentans]